MQFDNPIDFIKSLKSEHKAIIATIDDIDSQIIGQNNLQNSIDKLNRITEILFAHLEKEDKTLYPTLTRNPQTSKIAKKYSYDMERLSSITIDFFKRYCINKEGLKIFIEDFTNGYSLFKGLLLVRIKREELELYPAYILLESGVLHSEVLEYVKKEEIKKVNKEKERKILIYGQNEPCLKALELALEICGFKVSSTNSLDQISSMTQETKQDLILLDISTPNKEISNLITHLKDEIKDSPQLIGYSTNSDIPTEEKIEEALDAFIPQAQINLEALSEKISKVLLQN